MLRNVWKHIYTEERRIPFIAASSRKKAFPLRTEYVDSTLAVDGEKLVIIEAAS